MSNQRVTVTALIKVKQGMEESFKQEFLPVVALACSEKGCINYDLHQSVEDPTVFMLHENWFSKEILDQHLAMPYIKALGEKAAEFLVAPPEVMLWQQIVAST